MSLKFKLQKLFFLSSFQFFFLLFMFFFFVFISLSSLYFPFRLYIFLSTLYFSFRLYTFSFDFIFSSFFLFLLCNFEFVVLKFSSNDLYGVEKWKTKCCERDAKIHYNLIQSNNVKATNQHENLSIRICDRDENIC